VDDGTIPAFVALVGVPSVVGWIIIQRRAERHRHQAAFSARPPVPDDEYLRVVGADEADAPLWLAVRGIIAKVCGLPPSAIQPGDRLDDIWKCLPDGPDFLDLIFRLERALG